jgi:hypothetical protein
MTAPDYAAPPADMPREVELGRKLRLGATPCENASSTVFKKAGALKRAKPVESQ